MIGRVVSTKMNKTVAVLVTSTKTHPLYKKSFTRNKKFLAQDDLGVKEGDIVEMIKVSPISKRKHWKIVKVTGRDIEEIVEAELKQQAAAVIEEVMPEEKEELNKQESKNSESEVVMDDSTVKSKSKKKGRTQSSK